MQLIHGNFIKIISTILLLNINLLAGVSVAVNPPNIYKGEPTNFTISADGSDIEFPKIEEIEGYPIVGTSSSQSINVINGSMTKTTSKTYSFRPEKSLTIPSFTVTADGQEYQTNSLKLKVVQPQASKNGQKFVLEVSLNKSESYVGEPIDLAISFKQRVDAHAEQLQLGEPKLENFWVKKNQNVDHKKEGNYIIQTLHYKLFPQKSGEFKIPALEALIGLKEQRNNRDPFFESPFFRQQLNWQRIYSNTLKLKVKALPNGLELYGDYTIKASVDRKKVQANKPVNLTLTVEGSGNIDDIKKFNINIPQAIVYADEPKIISKLVKGFYTGTFREKVAIIADANFTIPSLKLEYFDKVTQSVKTIESEAIEIEVLGGESKTVKASSIEVSPSQTVKAPAPQLLTKTQVIIEKEDAYLKYLFLALGFALGIGLASGLFMLKNRESKSENDMIKAIKKAQGDRALFELLLPYSKKDEAITYALNQLEENLYRKGENKIEKELIMEVFD